jgi:hypothetical protein
MSFILSVPPPIQGALELVNISKRKADADSPGKQIDPFLQLNMLKEMEGDD